MNNLKMTHQQKVEFENSLDNEKELDKQEFEKERDEMIERLENVKDEQSKFRSQMIFYFFCERVWTMIPNGNEVITFEEFMEKWSFTLEEMYLNKNYKQEKP